MRFPEQEVELGRFDDLDDPGCREFEIGEGDWPFKGFVVRRGDELFAYQNYCMHLGHQLNWRPGEFLNENGSLIVCGSHGAVYEIDSGQCVSGPCPGKTLRAVAVELRDGNVVVKGPVSAA